MKKFSNKLFNEAFNHSLSIEQKTEQLVHAFREKLIKAELQCVFKDDTVFEIKHKNQLVKTNKTKYYKSLLNACYKTTLHLNTVDLDKTIRKIEFDNLTQDLKVMVHGLNPFHKLKKQALGIYKDDEDSINRKNFLQSPRIGDLSLNHSKNSHHEIPEDV